MKKLQLKPPEIIFQPEHKYRVYEAYNTPYWIQRMNFRKHINTNQLFNGKLPFNELIIADDMGRAEFENGDVEDAMKRVYNNIVNFNTYKTEITDRNEEHLYLFLHCSNIKPTKYEKCLKDIIKGKSITKRDIYLPAAIEKRDPRLSDITTPMEFLADYTPEIWFDIKNYIIFTFGLGNMDKIIDGLKTTIEQVKAGKKIPERFDSYDIKE